MSITRTSRDAKIRPSPLRTLLDVKEALTSATLTDRQRADLTSALKTMGRVHARPGEKDPDRALERMEADSRLLTKYFARVDGARYGLKRSSWNNLKFRVRQAVRLTGGGPRVANRTRACSPLWAGHFERLPRLPFQVALTSFVRFLDARQIAPGDVQSAHLETFANELEAAGLRKTHRATVLAARYNWNKAVESYPEFWPQTKLNFTMKFHNRYSLPWTAFAPSLEKEVKARTTVITAHTTNDPRAPSKPVRLATATQQEYDLRRFASALALEERRDPASLAGIKDLVEGTAPQSILAFLAGRVSGKNAQHSSGGLHLASQLLCNVAAHWVGVGEAELKALRKQARRTAPAGGRSSRRRGMTPKNRKTVNHFKNEEMVRRFVNLPESIYRDLLPPQGQPLRRVDAATLAAAFAIAMLQLAPVRPRNAARTQFEKNIIEQGSGASRRVALLWEPDEVKNSVELNFELTGVALELFDTYVARVRPRLCSPENPYLFPGRGLGPKDDSWFSTQLALVTERELGVRVTGQQFRHCMGLIYLLDHPGDYETVRQFLGHTDLRTTLDFYAGLEMADAAKCLDATVAKRRSELASLPARARWRAK